MKYILIICLFVISCTAAETTLETDYERGFRQGSSLAVTQCYLDVAKGLYEYKQQHPESIETLVQLQLSFSRYQDSSKMAMEYYRTH